MVPELDGWRTGEMEHLRGGVKSGDVKRERWRTRGLERWRTREVEGWRV